MKAQCTVSLHFLTEKGDSVSEGLSSVLYDIFINQMTGFIPKSGHHTFTVYKLVKACENC